MIGYPYTTSQGPLITLLNKLRSSFPSEITAKTIKKLGLAPQNESYLINTILFLGLITEEGKRNESETAFFNESNNEKFAKGLEKLIMKKYTGLFDLHKGAAWDLGIEELVTFFRADDSAGEVVGKRRAQTFQTLSALAGHGDIPEPKGHYKKNEDKGGKATKTSAAPSTTRARAKKPLAQTEGTPPRGNSPVALTVRIEVNLPSNGDQATYDKIFESIRKNFIDA
jgi:hypothetical protein